MSISKPMFGVFSAELLLTVTFEEAQRHLDHCCRWSIQDRPSVGFMGHKAGDTREGIEY
jgi:hypothetical protein